MCTREPADMALPGVTYAAIWGRSRTRQKRVLLLLDFLERFSEPEWTDAGRRLAGETGSVSSSQISLA